MKSTLRARSNGAPMETAEQQRLDEARERKRPAKAVLTTEGGAFKGSGAIQPV